MLFSIIIPVFNTCEFLPECIESLLSQTNDDFEAIFINDGSTDNSLTILNEYAQKDFRLIVKTIPQSGVSTARNIGLDIAKGDFILFLDSDDWILETTLETLYNTIKLGQYDIIGFNSSKYYCQTKELIPSHTQVGEYPNGWVYYSSCATQGNGVPIGAICGRIYSNTLIQTYQLRFDTSLQYNEDVLFFIKSCFYAQRTIIIESNLYFYRIRPSGSLMSTKTNRRFEDMAKFANNLYYFISNSSFKKNQNEVVFRTAASFYRNSLFWCEKKQRKHIRSIIIWPYFKHVSSLNAKSLLVFYAISLLPFSIGPLSKLQYKFSHN